jgi:hypothetical protein
LSGPGGCGLATRREMLRCGRWARGHPPQMTALTQVPEGELWGSFPEATRSDILGLLVMLLEQLAASTSAASHPTRRMRALRGASELALHLWAILGSNQ